MIKLSGETHDGRLIFMLILEPRNIELLQEGRPIRTDLQKLFPDMRPVDVIVHFTNDPMKTIEELKLLTNVIKAPDPSGE